MKDNESMEMYLETIYLLEKAHGYARNVDIARNLDVSKPSVTKAVKYLQSRGLVDNETYGTIHLTEKGRKISEEIYIKHEKLTAFLRLALGMNYDEAEQNACRMEHFVSEEMMEKVDLYLQKHQKDIPENVEE